MKKIFLSLLFILGVTFAGTAQKYSYGLTGGLNYSQGGQVTGDNSTIGNWDETLEGSGKVGFHGGAFIQVNFNKLFVRPEVLFTSLESEFNFPSRPSIYSITKFDIPILVGYRIWGPVDVFLGPVYSNIIDASMEGDLIESQIVVQNTPINAQVGTKVTIGRFEIGLRYEKNLSSTEEQGRRQFVKNGPEGYGVGYVFIDDARLDQIILNVSFKLGGTDMPKRRRRGGNCY